MTEILENDQLSMDRLNPYTATNTFGVSYNGGYKSVEALPWMLPREEESELDTSERPEYEAHFTPKHIFRAPAMTAMTGGVDPATSFMFPARKYQFDDGTTSWSREVVMTDGRNYTDFGPLTRGDLWPLIITMGILIFILALRKFKF